MASRACKIVKSVHSADQATFRALMIKARKDAGLTQTGLAKRLKKPQSFVAKYEGGERRIDLIEFLAITAAMNADPIKILRELIRKTA
ncbi:MAG: helix-turn-helix domain-containing protein [Pseudorhodoplanes sp.]|nr:helix-turn-helix domain-containing protein [Pseudorhodoplanes sp.]